MRTVPGFGKLHSPEKREMVNSRSAVSPTSGDTPVESWDNLGPRLPDNYGQRVIALNTKSYVNYSYREIQCFLADPVGRSPFDLTPISAPTRPPGFWGQLDTSFATDGYNTTTFNANGEQIFSLALQSVGKTGSKIVGGGVSYEISNGAFFLIRYNSDGSVDTSFATNGYNVSTFGTNGQIYSIAIQSDGKIVAGGYRNTGVQYVNSFVLIRYNSDGSLDTSFGTNGYNITTSGTNDTIYSIAIQPDGKIVAGGQATMSGVQGFSIARYNSDGSLDTTFGTNGFNTMTPGTNDIINSIAIQPDGKIVAGGFSTVNSNNAFALGRYNSDGSLDTSFATNGFDTTTPGTNDTIYSIALESDGKIVVGGYATVNNNYAFAIGRYNSDGTLDTSFGTGGYNTTTPGVSDYMYSIIFLSDGSLIAGGYSTESVTYANFLTIVHYI